MRKFRIFNKDSSKVVIGHGVGATECVRFPVFDKIDKPMSVCHSLVEMDDLDFNIEGYFTFRKLREGEVPNCEPENIEEVD